MKKYYLYNVKKTISVKNLITIEYLNIQKDFTYPEEEHLFYEFIYVDNGEIICNLNGKGIKLVQNDFLLIPPKTRHNYIPEKNKNNSSIFIVCFNSPSQSLSLIDGVFHLMQDEISIISTIFNESKNAFVFPFNRKIELIENPLFGSQQIVEQCIEVLLIKLVRAKINKDKDTIKVIMNNEKTNNIIADNIIKTLKDNVYNNISLEEISNTFFYSNTYLNKIFKKVMGKSIKQYFNFLKIEESKRLLNKNNSVMAVSDMLSFDNSNYFSKVFQKFTGKTPSQYKKAIQK